MLQIYRHADTCLMLSPTPGDAPSAGVRADGAPVPGGSAPDAFDANIAAETLSTPRPDDASELPAGSGTDAAAGDPAGDARNDAASDARIVWYDLQRPSPAEIAEVEAALGILLPTREEMQEIEASARLYHEDGAEFLTVTSLTAAETDAPVKSPVTFVLKQGALVTLRHADPRPFRSVSARMQKPNGPSVPNGEIVMLELLEGMIDRLADLLEAAGDEIDLVSREVFRKKGGNVSKNTRDLEGLIERVGRKAEMLSLVRESLVSIQRLSTYHQAVQAEKRKHGKEAKLRMKSIQRDVASLTDHSAFLSSKINFMLDATLGLINLQQNQIIKIFSVAAVVFLPPTLVASIYGMNFEVMPELGFRFGYPLALGLMVVTAILPYLYFKRRGWL